jgi:hypothetical protein
LADRLVEVYNLSGKSRLDQIMECFSVDVVVSNLKTRGVIQRGAQALRDSIPAEYAKLTAECAKRLYIESDDDNDPTFALDLYPAGQAPGINAVGKGNVKLDTLLLYRVRENKIDHVWIGPDKEGLAKSTKATQETVLGSKVFGLVAQVGLMLMLWSLPRISQAIFR